jgi:hypothetical protein
MEWLKLGNWHINQGEHLTLTISGEPRYVMASVDDHGNVTLSGTIQQIPSFSQLAAKMLTPLEN